MIWRRRRRQAQHGSKPPPGISELIPEELHPHLLDAGKEATFNEHVLATNRIITRIIANNEPDCPVFGDWVFPAMIQDELGLEKESDITRRNYALIATMTLRWMKLHFQIHGAEQTEIRQTSTAIVLSELQHEGEAT